MTDLFLRLEYYFICRHFKYFCEIKTIFTINQFAKFTFIEKILKKSFFFFPHNS